MMLRTGWTVGNAQEAYVSLDVSDESITISYGNDETHLTYDEARGAVAALLEALISAEADMPDLSEQGYTETEPTS